MPAMTAIAVTASICASAAEAALLVASFMPVSLDLGVTHRCAKRANDGLGFYSEHPTTSIRLFGSPLSEYRRPQGRSPLRRHFDSGVLLRRQPPDSVGTDNKTGKAQGKDMARIEYSDRAKASDRTREILDKNRNANIFRMMSHSPSYFEQYCRLGGAIRHKGELDPVVRELAITRTGILCEAPYEIVAHKRIGKNVGVTDEQNEALENWQSATYFNELQRAALAFTDEIVKLKKPTDATFKAVASKLTPAALVELQLSVGFYIMTSKFLETFEIDMQPVTEVVS
jgi:alkylhydroperoxidase family enzyme